MLGDCLGQISVLEVVLRCGSCKLGMVPCFCHKVLLQWVRSNGSLSEFYCLLVVDCTRYRDVTVKEAEDGEVYGL